ncbi:hypothetical protein SLEP1_g46357 [Rubroshorea leprosula]|uniref:Transporter-associated domain-containing protein n=1 Tax=Rubroshorea leprosula TaxID=152421 RepID=A0AAV5LMS9_9ROSI|nr:hypothetical protein SLEP1_g46357 [Rubroshorea leprosula]
MLCSLQLFQSVHFGGIYSLRLRRLGIVGGGVHLRSLSEENNDLGGNQGEVLGLDLESLKILLKRGVFIGAMLYCLLVFVCKRVLAMEGVVNAGSCSSTTVVLFGLEDDAGFLYVHVLRKLAEKESEDGVFRMLHSDMVTLEDVVEEIIGEIFDENDSKKEIQKKIGYIVMRVEGVYDVDANTSIYLPFEDLNIKMPEEHQYETVSGFLCEGFGYVPRACESIIVVLKRDNQDDDDDKHDEDGSNHRDVKASNI